ncbi:FtsX-like permease family protein [uncultured Hymenobacter sp.]|uniref:FtsX-like permease family protein n=1 Tax=uncultured Hymenobacter sp. TaxID=170016 RepID=UPI0035CB0524
MLRHIFKLIWNRKQSNLLLISEIFFSFVVLFGVGTVLITFGKHYLEPHGFSHKQVWRLQIAAGQGQKMPRTELDNVLRQVRALPGVQTVALSSFNTPFTFSTMNGGFHAGNNEITDVNHYDADDDYAAAMGLQLREGRWFKPLDNASTRRPAVITRDMREALFGAGPAVGRTFAWGDVNHVSDAKDEFQVVGVVEAVRTDNEFGPATPSVWKRLLPYDTTRWEGATVLVRVRPGEGGELQQKITRTVAGVTRQWTTEVRTMEDDRLNKRRYTLTPLVGLALIGGFLVVNVALGLFGVLWYNISQRRAEIGLRRAMGATGAAISRQFLGEMAMVTTLGVVLGGLLAAQFPLLGAFSLPPTLYVAAIAAAALLVYLITALCAFYPSRLAAGIRPAVALREE